MQETPTDGDGLFAFGLTFAHVCLHFLEVSNSGSAWICQTLERTNRACVIGFVVEADFEALQTLSKSILKPQNSLD